MSDQMNDAAVGGCLEGRLKGVLALALGTDAISYEDTIETVDVWDSMMHMEIIAALERAFSVRIEPADIIVMTSVKAIQKYLKSKGVL